MNPLYPFTALETVKSFQHLPKSQVFAEDDDYIASQLTIRKHQRLTTTAFRFASNVTAEQPISVSKILDLEHGVVIIPTKEGKTVFVSLHDRLAGGSDGWSIKNVVMIKLNAEGRVVRSKDGVQLAVKLSIPLNEQTNKNDAIVRRVSAMQKFDGSPYFPTNYACVYREGKRGRKICVFQEKALSDVQVYDNSTMPIYKFSELLKLVFCKTLIGALREFEKAKMVHRDIKPENILVFKTDDPTQKTTRIFKVGDFGYACRTDDEKATNHLCGSITYMPPEYIDCLTKEHGAAFKDTAGDLWALGVIVYYMANKDMPPIYYALSALEATPWDPEEFGKTFKQYLPNWSKARESLPLPPAKVESISDLAQAILQPSDKRISLDAANAAVDQLLAKYQK